MKELQQDVKEYLEERGWYGDNTEDYAKSLVIEAAELLEQFHRVSTTNESIQGSPERLGKIKSEVADVLFYCLDIACTLDFDLEEAFREKFEKVKIKYPVDQVKGSNEEYWKIKEEHRKQHGR